MAKKTKKERYAGKSVEEWRDWGERFGKRMDKTAKKFEKRSKDFGEEIEELTEKFGEHMERKSKRWEKHWNNWGFRTFGFIGPIIGSVFGIVFLAFGLWVLNLVNIGLGNRFISDISIFLFRNIHLLFISLLVSGYSDYSSRRYHKSYWTVSPIFNTIGTVIFIWILVGMLNLVNKYVGSGIIVYASNFLYTNLAGIFILILVLGYIFVIIKKFIKDYWED